MADFADRSLGIGYAGGTAILFILLIGSFSVWHRTLGSVSIDTISSPISESFYWITVMFSQTLGTALVDWTADTAGLGYTGGIIIFVSLLSIVTITYYWTKISHTILFWLAFVLTRPLGAVGGDLLDKPIDQGGFDLSRFAASGVLLALMMFFIFISSHVGEPKRSKQQIKN